MKVPKFITNNLLLKITSLNSLAMSIRMLIAFASQKVVAILLGPEGVGLIGNLRNLFPMLESFSTLGTFNGIVKYVSQYKEDEKELHQLFSTTMVYVISCSITAFLVLFFGANHFNNWLIKSTVNYSYVFKLIAVSVPFIAINRVFNAILNGLSAYKKFVNINLLTYVISALVLVISSYLKNITGALIAIALTPIIQFSILCYFYIKIIKKYVDFKGLTFKIPYKNKLIQFTIMSIVATFLGGFVDIKLRTYLMDHISLSDAGYWTGMTNIAKQYMMFSSAIFTLYVIPKFATINDSKTFRLEVLNIYKVLLPAFAIGMLSIYFCREWVILFAKSKEFLEMKPLFKWQLMGDFIKLMSIIMAHQFLAKKMVVKFVISELLSLLLFYFFANYFIQSMGVEGVVFGHFLRNISYFILVIIMLRKHLFGNRTFTS